MIKKYLQSIYKIVIFINQIVSSIIMYFDSQNKFEFSDFKTPSLGIPFSTFSSSTIIPKLEKI